MQLLIFEFLLMYSENDEGFRRRILRKFNVDVFLLAS